MANATSKVMGLSVHVMPWLVVSVPVVVVARVGGWYVGVVVSARVWGVVICFIL